MHDNLVYLPSWFIFGISEKKNEQNVDLNKKIFVHDITTIALIIAQEAVTVLGSVVQNFGSFTSTKITVFVIFMFEILTNR